MAGGVVLFVAPDATSPAKLEAAIRCHHAALRLHDNPEVDDPLELPGIRTAVRGDASGLTIEITVDDVELVPELQRRSTIMLETGRGHAATHH